MADQLTIFDTDTSASSEIERLRADLAADRRELTRLGDLLHGYRRREAEAYRERHATARRAAWQAVTGAARPPYITGHAELTAAAEIQWLRTYIDQAGRRLHAVHGDPNPPVGDRCRCPGCDLIVGTDLGDRPECADLPARNDVQRRLMDAEIELERARQFRAFQDARIDQLILERDRALRGTGQSEETHV